jgi:pimeloyl-ACP methyl ester carboxylesterase
VDEVRLGQPVDLLRDPLWTRALLLIPSDIGFWQRRFPSVRLIAHYGSSEVMGGCCSNQIAEEVLVPLRPHGSLPPLFCIHPAAGLSWCYPGLLQHLRTDYPIYALQARGLKHKESLPQTLEEMVLDYLDQIRKIQPSGPYHLLGWSFGGILAYRIQKESKMRPKF